MTDVFEILQRTQQEYDTAKANLAKLEKEYKKMTQKREPSSQIEIDAAIGLYREGYKVDTIATALGRHWTTVYGWFRNNGIQLRTTPNWSKYRKVARQRNELKDKVAQQFALHI